MKRRFAFIIHPREISDLYRRFSWVKKIISDKMAENFLVSLGKFPFPKRSGFTICSHFDVYNKVEGYLVAVLLTGKQIITLDHKLVKRRIIDAILFAQNVLGCEVVGLGALTKSAVKGGKLVVERPEIETSITHGDTLTAAIAVDAVNKIIQIRKIKNPKIAIVGAYGVIGSAVSKQLAGKHDLVLIGHHSSLKLKKLAEEIKNENHSVLTSANFSCLREADIIVTATNHPKAILQPSHLKADAVVYDLAQPANAGSKLLKERPDIIRIDGGYVNIPNIDLKFNMGPPRGTTFACCAETILQTLKGDRAHHVGEINISYLKLLENYAKKWNFRHAPFTCFGKRIKKL